MHKRVDLSKCCVTFLYKSTQIKNQSCVSFDSGLNGYCMELFNWPSANMDYNVIQISSSLAVIHHASAI